MKLIKSKISRFQDFKISDFRFHDDFISDRLASFLALPLQREEGVIYSQPGSGFRVLGSGFWVPGSGFRVPGSGFRGSGGVGAESGERR